LRADIMKDWTFGVCALRCYAHVEDKRREWTRGLFKEGARVFFFDLVWTGQWGGHSRVGVVGRLAEACRSQRGLSPAKA
jgi:hypothetical protein